MILMEAGAAGRPAVGWDRGGIPEVVDDGVTGYVVPFRDLPRMARAIQRLCDADLRRQMGAAGRARACERFSPDANDRALAAPWSAILGSRRA